ncbi:hypothetical protein VTN00DRAFT_2390 [Thermoascus crustaceus]|uniref:uncharacterized protein n=1 Tax=Thermoascus crustaceus TaxID=5088 RepID=UPI00374331B1
MEMEMDHEDEERRDRATGGKKEACGSGSRSLLGAGSDQMPAPVVHVRLTAYTLSCVPPRTSPSMLTSCRSGDAVRIDMALAVRKTRSLLTSDDAMICTIRRAPSCLPAQIDARLTSMTTYPFRRWTMAVVRHPAHRRVQPARRPRRLIASSILQVVLAGLICRGRSSSPERSFLQGPMYSAHVYILTQVRQSNTAAQAGLRAARRTPIPYRSHLIGGQRRARGGWPPRVRAKGGLA